LENIQQSSGRGRRSQSHRIEIGAELPPRFGLALGSTAAFADICGAHLIGRFASHGDARYVADTIFVT
jgi:hypothetical protein